MGTGADDFLAKPSSAEELLVRVENLIELRRWLRDRFSGEVRLGPSNVTVPSQDAAFLEEIRDMVEAGMGDSALGVDDLAAEVGLSTRQLQRRLRAAYEEPSPAASRSMSTSRIGRGAKVPSVLPAEVRWSS